MPRTIDQQIAAAPRTTEQMLANRRAWINEQAALRLGREAFTRGAKRVPAHDPAVLPLLSGQGLARANVLLAAWLRGWDAENLAAPLPGCGT